MGQEPESKGDTDCTGRSLVLPSPLLIRLTYGVNKLEVVPPLVACAISGIDSGQRGLKTPPCILEDPKLPKHKLGGKLSHKNFLTLIPIRLS